MRVVPPAPLWLLRRLGGAVLVGGALAPGGGGGGGGGAVGVALGAVVGGGLVAPGVGGLDGPVEGVVGGGFGTRALAVGLGGAGQVAVGVIAEGGLQPAARAVALAGRGDGLSAPPADVQGVDETVAIGVRVFGQAVCVVVAIGLYGFAGLGSGQCGADAAVARVVGMACALAVEIALFKQVAAGVVGDGGLRLAAVQGLGDGGQAVGRVVGVADGGTVGGLGLGEVACQVERALGGVAQAVCHADGAAALVVAGGRGAAFGVGGQGDVAHAVALQEVDGAQAAVGFDEQAALVVFVADLVATRIEIGR